MAAGLLAATIGLRVLGPALMSGELGLLVHDRTARRPLLRRLLNL
jgi:hypothetical protein